MRIFTFRYQKGVRKKVLSELNEVLLRRKPIIHKDEMLCDSIDTLLKCISKSRMEAFLAIIEQQPESIYELANRLEKNHANVLKDVNALEDMGLIRLTSIRDGNREKLKPETLYDKIVVELGQLTDDPQLQKREVA